MNSDKKGDSKREAEKDRPLKRIPLPPMVSMLCSLDLPLDMVDPAIYLEAVKKCLVSCKEQAKNYNFTDLSHTIDGSIDKVQSMMSKGLEEYVKKKREKEIGDAELYEILKKPNSLAELEELNVSKIKNTVLRDKITSLLAKRVSSNSGADDAPKKLIKLE
jgi:hypothetical protein